MGYCLMMNAFILDALLISYLIVKVGISEVKESISNLRECVKYIRSSFGCLQLF